MENGILIQNKLLFKKSTTKIRFTNCGVFELFLIKYVFLKKNSTKVLDPEIKFNFVFIFLKEKIILLIQTCNRLIHVHPRYKLLKTVNDYNIQVNNIIN